VILYQIGKGYPIGNFDFGIEALAGPGRNVTLWTCPANILSLAAFSSVGRRWKVRKFSTTVGGEAPWEPERYLVAPRNVFQRPDFDRSVAAASEKYWEKIETDAGNVLKKLRAVSPPGFALTDLEESRLRDLMALHFVRSSRTQLVWDQLVRRSFQDGPLAEVTNLLTDPVSQVNLIRAVFGLVPAGSEMRQLVRRRTLYEFVDPLLAGGDIFVAHVIEVLEKCRSFLLGMPIWLGFASPGCDLVIGDCPVINPDQRSPGRP
jgi:hypothetical protein